jgi:hypothetical protein
MVFYHYYVSDQVVYIHERLESMAQWYEIYESWAQCKFYGPKAKFSLKSIQLR